MPINAGKVSWKSYRQWYEFLAKQLRAASSFVDGMFCTNILFWGGLMVGYSYFDYDQMTLLGIEVHSDELELLRQTVDTYDWKAIETEMELKFRKAAIDFRDQNTPLYVRVRMDWIEDFQQSFPSWTRWWKLKWPTWTGIQRQPAGRVKNPSHIWSIFAGSCAEKGAELGSYSWESSLLCGLWVHSSSCSQNVEILWLDHVWIWVMESGTWPVIQQGI